MEGRTQIRGYFHPTNIGISLSFEEQAGNALLNLKHENTLNTHNLDFTIKKTGGEEELNFEIVTVEDEKQFYTTHIKLISFY
ncbi:hypothetical protein LX73_0352 [Fodinibius salinus]|uniref:Uncharacterized protein n=1 Tax=Fodinibius salinus TaxID=860790 RepID=A0A5D3YMN7_9BACT|nr:hypothetical protein [Fodinibius salinus]TYP95057.1 hypothetical protein LX73_0352 [Fodinibius salinus]